MINEKKVQKTYKDKILEIFKVFVEICETYNLQYFCHGGTTIGVIRHQGFIPWDDDIDVLMPREDYERFLKLFPTIDKNNYELHSPNQEQYYYLPFTKMCDANTTLLEFPHIPYIIGAFIDIFPLDGASSESQRREQDWLGFRRTANKLMILPKSSRENFKWFFKRIGNFQIRTALYEIECAFNKRKKLSKVQRKLANYMTAYAYNESEFVGSYGSQFGVKAFWPKEWFSDYITKDFEGIKVRVPIGYDKLLTQVYGNYMKLPPEEKRVSGHHVAYLNLDKRLGDKEVLSLLNK